MTQTTKDSNTYLSERGAQMIEGRVSSFSDLSSEVQTLTTGAGLVPLLTTTPLRLTGADRLDFLHGQVSNEVKRLKPGETNTSLMLNVKGHALAQMRVYRREDDLFVAVEGGAGAFVQRELQAHIIFDQVEIENLAEAITSFTLQGPRAQEVLKEVFSTDLPNEGTFIQPPFESAKVLISSKKRSETGGYDLHVLSKDAPALFEKLEAAGATLAGEDALEAVRVAAGIASAQGEGGEGALPQEVGLEHAVSYRKGCYLGQEIMARIEARGKLRKGLRGLKFVTLPQNDRGDLLLDGKKAGRLGSVVEHPALGVIGLASVRMELDSGTEVEVGEVTATLSDVPFA